MACDGSGDRHEKVPVLQVRIALAGWEVLRMKRASVVAMRDDSTSDEVGMRQLIEENLYGVSTCRITA